MTQASHFKEAEKALAKVKAELKIALERKQVAETQAQNLEKRNQEVLASIEQEGSAKRKTLVDNTAQELEQIKSEVNKATEVRDGLLDEVSELNLNKTALTGQVDSLELERLAKNSEISVNSQKLDELDRQVTIQLTENRDLRGKAQDLRDQIAELNLAIQQIKQDKEILNVELDNLEDDIIETDAQFKAVKADKERQIAELEERLQNTTHRLMEAQKQDKQMREAWADEHLKLDKRTETVRKLEARVSDAEKRVAEFDNYMKL